MAAATFLQPTDTAAAVPPLRLNQTLNATDVNVSSTAPSGLQRDENLVRVEVAIQAFIFCLAVFGNGCVLFALRHGKKKTSRMHVFIMHLCIADMLVAFFNILPQMIWDITFRFKGNDFLCRTVKYLQVMVIYLSTYILVMTAVDRYRAICHPISSYSWAPRKVNIMIAIAWVLALVLSAPQLALFQMQEVGEGSGEYDCWAHFYPEWTVKVYITAFCMCVYIIPSFILVVLYGRISFTVWTNVYRAKPPSGSDVISASTPSAQSASGRNLAVDHVAATSVSSKHSGTITYKFNGTGQISVLTENNSPVRRNPTEARRHFFRGMSRAKMKTIKLTFVVIMAYLVCWSPFIITQMWWAYDTDAPYNSSTFVICLLLASLNSCCNPWIYMAFSGGLIQQSLPCCRHCKRRHPGKNKQRHPLAPCGKDAPIPMKKINKKPLLENIQLQTKQKMADAHKRSRLPWRNKTTNIFSRTASTKLTGFLSPSGDVTPKSRPHVANVNINSREKRQHAMKGCDCATCTELLAKERPDFLKEQSAVLEDESETSFRNGKRRPNSSYPFLFYKPFNYEKVEMKCTSV